MVRVLGEVGAGRVVATLSLYPPSPTVWLCLWFPYQGEELLLDGPVRRFRDWLAGDCARLRVLLGRREFRVFRAWAVATLGEFELSLAEA